MRESVERKRRLKRRQLLLGSGLFVLLVICLVRISVLPGIIEADRLNQAALQAEADLSVLRAAKEAKRNEPVYVTLPSAEPVRAIVEDYTEPTSLWAVVNKQRAIPLSYIPPELTLLTVETRQDKSAEERSVRKDIIKPLEDMFGAAKLAGHSLMVGSAYRSPELQAFYSNNIAATSGEETASLYSAVPGQSEHQLGLAVDISTVSRECYLSACFTSLPDGEWLAANAHTYGFILRYPEGKEAITGYNFEPWHYRYVGIELAKALHASGLTLDEAWPYLESALQTLKKNGAI